MNEVIAKTLRQAMVAQLTQTQRVQLTSYQSKTAGWFTVAAGAALLAAGETWQLVRHYRWPTWMFWLLVVVMLTAAVLNTAVLMIGAARTRRAGAAEPAAVKVLPLSQCLPHNRMNKKMLTGLAIGAVAALSVTAVPANAASISCGDACFTLTTQEFGPGYVSAAPAGTVTAGAPVVMTPGSSLLREDFQSGYDGTASVAYGSGQLVAAAVAQGWPQDPVFQFFYAPGGVRSGLCLGVAGAAESGTEVTLQPCSTPQRTEWVALTGDADNGYMPLISGTDTSAADPLVLTANSQSSAFSTGHLVTYPGNAYPETNQMWKARYGVIRSYLISPIPPRL